MRLPLFNDALGQNGTDGREPLELVYGRMIDVQPTGS